MHTIKNYRLNASILFIVFSVSLFSCAGSKNASKFPQALGGQTSGEGNPAASYIPLDPLPVFQEAGRNCPMVGPTASIAKIENNYKSLLASLPDQAVRLSIAQLDESGSLSHGPVAEGYEGNSYQVTLDYITADAIQLPVYVKRTIASGSKAGERVSVFDRHVEFPTRYVTEAAPRINPNDRSTTILKTDTTKGDLVVLPAYVGVGLRLTALVIVQKGKVNLSSLASIAAGAEAGKLTGTLTVQTLGITGDHVSSMLPLPSEINQATIQNAILALGSIKAVMHDANKTILSPRVVGIYNPIGGGQDMTNGIISRLAEQPITWYRPCIGELGK